MSLVPFLLVAMYRQHQLQRRAFIGTSNTGSIVYGFDLGEKVWLKRRFKDYDIKGEDISELKLRLDIIPTSIAIAQAAKESGWGTSRFALEGNAMYGQWTWGGDGIEPSQKDKKKEHKILKFPKLQSSVSAYMKNLNTHRGYSEFRKERSKIREKNKTDEGIDLVKYLLSLIHIYEHTRPY